MAADPYEGADLTIEVLDESASPPSYVDVDDMNSYQRGSSRNRTSVPVFMRALPRTLPGTREITYTISGLLDTGSAGQDILRAASQADTEVTIRITRDGTNGFTQKVRVGTTGENSTPENFQETSFELIATEDAVIEGTGPLPG